MQLNAAGQEDDMFQLVKKKNIPDLHRDVTWSDGLACCHLLKKKRKAGHAWWNVHACCYQHPSQENSISGRPLPRCARSPISGVRHHSAGVSSNLIQEALRGVFGVNGLPTSLWARRIQTLGGLNQRGRQIIPPPAGCRLRYEANAGPLQLNDKHIVELKDQEEDGNGLRETSDTAGHCNIKSNHPLL